MGDFVLFGAFFTEYMIQVGIAAGVVGGLGGISLAVGSVVGIIYLIYFILEEEGVVEDNPIDEFIFDTIPQWMETIGNSEYVRIPLIWFEY